MCFRIYQNLHWSIWHCVFKCFAKSAVHLELVCDLTTDSIIGSLTRFPSTEVCPKIYTLIMQRLLWEQIISYKIYIDLWHVYMYVFTTENNQMAFYPSISTKFWRIMEICSSNLKQYLNQNLSSEYFYKMNCIQYSRKSRVV